jgi:hypothetical protein
MKEVVFSLIEVLSWPLPIGTEKIYEILQFGQLVSMSRSEPNASSTQV